jgi:hypothetical protein
VAECVENISGGEIKRNEEFEIVSRNKNDPRTTKCDGWLLGEEFHGIGGESGWLGHIQIGKGRVVVTTGADIFDDRMIGGENAIPNSIQLGHRVIAQWLFDTLLDVQQDGLSGTIPFAEDFYVSGSASVPDVERDGTK